jgi:hypothetical protein
VRSFGTDIEPLWDVINHLRSIIEAQYPRRDAAVRDDHVEFVGQPLRGDGSLHEAAQAFAGVLIDGG